MWLARNKSNGKLWIFTTKPLRWERGECWVSQLYDKKGNERISYHTKIGEITRQCFDLVQWENGPIEIDIIPVNPIDKTKYSEVSYPEIDTDLLPY